MSNQQEQQMNNNQVQQPQVAAVQSNPVTQQVVNPNQPTAPVQPQSNTAPTLAEPQRNQVAEGVNLIPSLTKEQKSHVKKKNTLNIGFILSIIVLATVSIGIVGFNIISKTQLTAKQNALKRIEKTVNSKVDKIASNNIILKRVRLYQDVKANSFSHKKIIEFFLEVSTRVQGITYDGIEISEDLSFELSGSAPDLEQLSRLWYLFGVNENIEKINLDSFGKSNNRASFSFEGKLILENFRNE